MSERQLVRVVSYAGGKGEERPVAFQYRKRKLRILDIVERWVENDSTAGLQLRWYFRVRADDHMDYLLLYDSEKGQWFLELD